eukprot:scaffold261004_cov12-Tisochrysis_lutea.AAC.1
MEGVSRDRGRWLPWRLSVDNGAAEGGGEELAPSIGEGGRGELPHSRHAGLDGDERVLCCWTRDPKLLHSHAQKG